MSTPIVQVPKGKSVLEFLQEMDGANGQLKKQWTFLSKELIDVLYRQLREPKTSVKGTQITIPILCETDGLTVGSITVMRNLNTGWYLLISVNCSNGSCPYHISFVNAFEDDFCESVFVSVAT